MLGNGHVMWTYGESLGEEIYLFILLYGLYTR